MQGLHNQGHEVKYLATDNAINIDPATEYLIPEKAPYIHLLDYLKDNARVSTITKQILDQTFSNNRNFLNYVSAGLFVYSVREFVETVVSFETLLSESPPDIMLVLHENNFWTKTIAYLCSVYGVPCVGFQEGLLRHRDQKTYNKQSTAAEYTNKLLVWSGADAVAYNNAGISEDKISVVGIPHLDEMLQAKKDKEKWAALKTSAKQTLGYSLERPLVVLALPQLDRFEGDVNFAVSSVVGHCIASNIQVCVSLHPFAAESSRVELESHLKASAQVFRSKPAPLLLLAADALVCQHSTIAVEALAMDVPLLEIDLSNYGVLQSLAEDGVAVRVGPNELDKINQVLLRQIILDTERVETWKCDHLGPLDGLATDRATQAIMSLIT